MPCRRRTTVRLAATPTARSATWALLPQSLGQVGSELAGVDVQPGCDITQPCRGFVERRGGAEHIVHGAGCHRQIARLDQVEATPGTAAVERSLDQLAEPERLTAVATPCGHIHCAAMARAGGSSSRTASVMRTASIGCG